MTLKRALVAVALVAVLLLSAALVVVISYDYNKLKPQIEGAFKEATGRDLALKGRLDLRIGLSPTLVVNEATIGNASWGSRPAFAEIKRLEVQVSLISLIFRRIDVKRLILIDPNILIETNNGGESNLEFLQKSGPKSTEKKGTAPSKVSFSINQMSIKTGQLEYRNGRTGAAHVVFLDHFDVSAPGAEDPLKLSMAGKYNKIAFSMTGKAVPLASFSDNSRSWPLTLNATVAGMTIVLEGTIKDVLNLQGLDVKTAVKSADLKKIGEFWGGQSPLEGPLNMTGRLTDPRPKTYEVSGLTLTAGGSDLAGSIGVDLSRPRLAITADLQSRRIDVRALTGEEKAEKAPAKAAAPGSKVFPDSPLPLGFLQSIDALVALKAAEVFTSQIVLHSLDTKLVLSDGRLSVKPLTALIGGGKLDGRLDLDSRDKGAELSTQITVTQLDVASMLRELKKTDVLDGRMDMRINVRGKGSSIAGMMSGLNGLAYTVMGQGKINNKYLKILGSSLGSDVFRLINPFHKDQSATRVSCLVCGFKITDGVADTTAFVVNSDYMSVVGNGSINLRTEGLDFSLRPVPKEGIGTGLTGKLTMGLGELARPFKLAGTLAHPSMTIDLTQTALTAGKAIGGFMLLGPAGLGAAMVGSSSGDAQLCPLAIKAAEQGVKLSSVQKGQEKGVVGKTTESVEKGIGAVEKGLKRLFGK
jgi:AsmA family protein